MHTAKQVEAMSSEQSRTDKTHSKHDRCPGACPYESNYEAIAEVHKKVNMLVSELIDGNTRVGRVGHMKRTNDRLEILEEKIERHANTRLSPENVEIVNKVIDLFGSYRFVAGMLITTFLALVGFAKLAIEIAKIFRGG